MTDEENTLQRQPNHQGIKRVEGGRTVKAVCREYGIAEATYCSWKSKYGGVEASDIKRLKELEEENRR